MDQTVSSNPPSGLAGVQPAPLRPWAWGAACALLGLAFVLDGPIIDRLGPAPERIKDLHMMFRVLGSAPTWIAVAVVTALAVSGTPQAARVRWEMALVVVTAGVAGLLAAVLKPIVRRTDLANSGPYPGWQWTPWGDEPWDGTDVCFPSEHAAVAWGACVALSRFRPAATPALLLLALGTAAARVRARGHHPSDVMASLVVALVASWLVGNWLLRRVRPRDPQA